MDYEQKYYDLLYENRKLQNEIDNLKSEIEAYNIIDKYGKSGLVKYVICEITKRRNK